MDLKKYFRGVEGKGYLATAGAGGRVNVAVYARPHVIGDGILAFGMADRRTHANLTENPHAVYAFVENGWRGKRIYMEKVHEESEGPLLEEIKVRADDIVGVGAGANIKFVVHFKVTEILPLVGI